MTGHVRSAIEDLCHVIGSSVEICWTSGHDLVSTDWADYVKSTVSVVLVSDRVGLMVLDEVHSCIASSCMRSGLAIRRTVMKDNAAMKGSNKLAAADILVTAMVPVPVKDLFVAVLVAAVVVHFHVAYVTNISKDGGICEGFGHRNP